MATPITAIVLRRSRRRPWAKDESARAFLARQATSGAAPSSASRRLFPLMLRRCPAGTSRSSVIVPSGVLDPRIQEGVGEIDDQVDGVDAERTEVGHREERLHYDGFADEEADLQAYHRHGRDQRVLERVLQHDR